MQAITCPIDNTPCDPECPDRFHDQPEGGCILTLAQELGAKLLPLGGGYTAMIFSPEGGDAGA